MCVGASDAAYFRNPSNCAARFRNPLLCRQIRKRPKALSLYKDWKTRLNEDSNTVFHCIKQVTAGFQNLKQSILYTMLNSLENQLMRIKILFRRKNFISSLSKIFVFFYIPLLSHIQLSHTFSGTNHVRKSRFPCIVFL
jgi:hypothetical protein